MKVYVWRDSGLETLVTEHPGYSSDPCIEVPDEEWREFKALEKAYYDKIKEFERRAGWKV